MAKLFKLCLVLLLIGGCFKKEEKDNLLIHTAKGEAKYSVENAVTSEELQKGLMNREALAEDCGMFFDLSYNGPRTVSMWMKNTKLPLDMLFLDINGKVIWTYENAIPYSEAMITPPMPVAYVIELNAGQVQKNDIQIGDMVKHNLIDPNAKHEDPMFANPEINDNIADDKHQIVMADEDEGLSDASDAVAPDPEKTEI